MRLDPSNHSDYMIMAAIRGHDVAWSPINDDLKFCTTAVLRGIVGAKPSSGFVTLPGELAARWRKADQDAVRLKYRAGGADLNSHFKSHFQGGITHLRLKLERGRKHRPLVAWLRLYEAWVQADLAGNPPAYPAVK